MPSLNGRKQWFQSAALFLAAAALLPGQTSPPNPQASPPTPPAQVKGPPIPPGTGGPGGTSQAERMQEFLAIGAPPDPAAVQRGKTFFIATCGFCHGANAKGGESGPDLVRSVLVLHDANGDKIGPVVHGGRKEKGMPAFPNITNAQISDIAAFLKSRYQAAANRGAYQLQNIVTGDPKAGETYFTEKCKSCHSPTGDLAGVASKYQPDGLQNLFLYPRVHGPETGEKSNATTPKVTVTLSSGQTFSGTLNSLDDFDISLTDASGAYHSWPLSDNGIKYQIQDPLAAHLELLKHYTNTDMHNILAYLETLK